MEPEVKMEIFKTEDGFDHLVQPTEIESVTEVPAVRLSETVFVKYLTKYGQILLCKSQKTNEKIKKNKAVAKICQSLRAETGISYTPRQILKRLHNLKSKLKTKRDACINEGSKLNLNPAEKVLLNLIDGTGRNICNDAIISDSKKLQISDVIGKYDDNDNEFITPILSKGKNNSTASKLKQKKCSDKSLSTPSPYLNKLPNNLETSDTRELTLEQLERISVLKQLKIMDMQERLIQKQLIIAQLRVEELSKHVTSLF